MYKCFIQQFWFPTLFNVYKYCLKKHNNVWISARLRVYLWWHSDQILGSALLGFAYRDLDMVFYLFLENNSKKKCNCIIPLLQKKKLNWYSEDASCSLVCTDLLLLRRLSETEFKLLFFLGYSKEIYVLIWRINKNNIKSLIYRPLCFNWYSNVAIMAAAEISNKTRARTIGHLLLFDSLISGIMTLSDLMIY